MGFFIIRGDTLWKYVTYIRGIMKNAAACVTAWMIGIIQCRQRFLYFYLSAIVVGSVLINTLRIIERSQTYDLEGQNEGLGRG